MGRVLVVDDNRDATNTLALLLTHWGFDVRVAYDGQGAVAVAKEFSPEIVLLDLKLPRGMSGYDVAHELRQMHGGSAAAIIALTGLAQEEDRRRTKEAGFYEHLAKPVDPDALRVLLADICGGGRETPPS